MMNFLPGPTYGSLWWWNVDKLCLCPPIILSIVQCKHFWQKAGLWASAESSWVLLEFFLSAADCNLFGKLWHIFFAACSVSLWTGWNARVFDNCFWSAARMLAELAELITLWSSRAVREEDTHTMLSWANSLR